MSIVPESSSLITRQSVRSSISSNPFDDFAPYEEAMADSHGQEHPQQNTNTSPMDASSSRHERFFNSDFDSRNEFWPSSVHEPHRSSTDATLPPAGKYSEDQGRSASQSQATSHIRSTESYWMGVPFTGTHPGSDSSSRPRVDHIARNTLREMIVTTILSEAAPSERVALLDDCKTSAGASELGIPFREILSAPMDDLGVPPLMYEIMGCQPDWDGINDPELGTGVEMVLYLIENWSENVLVHGKMGVCMNVVRTACLRRMDDHEGNRLFQYLRPLVSQLEAEKGRPVSDCDISIVPLGGTRDNQTDDQNLNLDFTALISIPHFASRLTQLSSSETTGDELCPIFDRKPPSTPPATCVSVEFLAGRRAWRLKVDSNLLALELLDGPTDTTTTSGSDPLPVDARVKVIMPERGELEQTFASASTGTDAPVELFLPRLLLRPRDGMAVGTSETKLSPCFCSVPGDYNAIGGLDDARFLHGGRSALLLELTVRIGKDHSGFTFIDLQNNNTRNTVSVAEAGPPDNAMSVWSESDDGDLYVPSEVDLHVQMSEMNLGPSLSDSEWEEVSQVDETEAKEGGWVEASWSSRDKEL